jgi:hypothetical protein
VGKITALLKMNITAPDWAAAKALLTDAMTPERGKCYIRVERRPSRQHGMEPVRLDIADCWESPREGADAEGRE